ncbi:capping protein, Arp2/3 and myosin-I linker protein 2 isoform X1 [Takifugu rubripes]|uniref:capping protein, Arp2/3 and myosin-I linker protein 2 isoform X1 n=1 Tax=Takifugu rubripes TaxID=31033 RepID=UPI00114600B6|nr:capping protein, Arp2/3 and myosin-I linker protein 3 isoform X1 [Takifugu rubripes]
MNSKIKGHISELLKPHRVCLVTPVLLSSPAHTCHRFLVLSLWRGYLVTSNLPVKVETTFSYLDICSIGIPSITQVVLETDRQTLSFSVTQVEDLEAVVLHMTTSVRRIFPDCCPGKLLKVSSLDLQQRLLSQDGAIEEQLRNQHTSCGGYSQMYAALCDFNEMLLREEVQWEVDNIYSLDEQRRFNLLDFRHLEDRDLALAVAALSFNQWFRKLYSKEYKLSADVQEQLILLLSRSVSLQEFVLESCGLKPDFPIKMAAALQENPSSTLRSIDLSGNVMEDKGIIALSQELVNLPEGLKHLSLSRVSMTGRGLAAVSQTLLSSKLFSTSLTHLDLSGNPGCLATQEATFLFRFLSTNNSVSFLDLSDTSCPLDTVFVSLSAGCCNKLKHLDLSRNPFSHRKACAGTRSIQEFFSRSRQLKYVCLCETRLPPVALRLLLQGLATNRFLFGLELDLSSCELRSPGAQVIQEHISEATALRSLNISDNGFEDDVVTLILSIGRCRALRQLSLGRNFALKSRNLADALHRIAQLIQDEECPLQSLSLRDSKLKTDVSILLKALAAPAVLTHVDITGNNAGDTGARLLARALRSNTRLRSLSLDRNNVTVKGFQDLANALERNFTLQRVLLPLNDVTKSFHKDPKETQEALDRIQQYLDRNNRRHIDQVEPQQLQQPEKLQRHAYQQLEDKLRHLSKCDIEEADVIEAREALNNVMESIKLVPHLYEAGCQGPDGDVVISTLSDTATKLNKDFNRSIQELADDLQTCAEESCPRLLQQASVCEYLTECVSQCCRQAHEFIRHTLLKDAGQKISSMLGDLKQTLKMSVAENMAELLLQHVAQTCHQKRQSFTMEENSGPTLMNNLPEFLPVDNFPTDDYSPTFRRSKPRIPPSVTTVNPDQPIRRGGDAGGGQQQLGRPSLSLATPLPVRASSPSPSISPPLSPQGRRRRGEVLVVDAAAATSKARAASTPPPPPPPAAPAAPLLYSPPSRAVEEEAAHHGGVRTQQALIFGCGSGPGPLLRSTSPMEPLPTQGQALRHFTASRPRPRRTQTPLPSSRPQEPDSKVDVSEGMCRVDEGVEEFFTKKILPDYALKGRWEESNPAQATPSEPSPTPSDLTLISSLSDISSSDMVPVTSPSIPSTDTSTKAPHTSSSPNPTPVITITTTTPPTKNIKKKFGDFFAFKRARGSRAPKSGTVDGGEGVKVKRPSIVDLIRPLREAKERERDREREREKGTWAKSVEDANISTDATTTEGSDATSRPLASDTTGTTAPANMLTTTMHPIEATPSYATRASKQEEKSLFNSPTQSDRPAVDSTESDRWREETLMKERQAGFFSEERRVKMTKRLLREGKSQSLILLSGSDPEDTGQMDSKKRSSEGAGSFEHRLNTVIPHKGGVDKSAPAGTRKTQRTEEELRKTSSEGARLDRPEPPLTHVKPRTMSTSSGEADALLRTQLKPVIPKRPAGLLPPQKVGGAAVHAFSSPPSISSAERVQLRPHARTAENGHQESSAGVARAGSPGKERFPQAPLPRRSPCKPSRCEKSQSTGDAGSLPKPCHLMKPLPQRRVVSVHEDTLAMTEELKAVLRRSPVHLQVSGVDQLTCSQVPSRSQQHQPAGDRGNAEELEYVLQAELMAEGGGLSGTRGSGDSRHVHPGEEECSSSRWFSSKAQRLAPAVLDPTLEKKPHSQTIAKMVAPTPGPEKTSSRVPESQEPPEAIQADHVHRTVASKPDVRNSTQEGTETGSKGHKTKSEAAVLPV